MPGDADQAIFLANRATSGPTSLSKLIFVHCVRQINSDRDQTFMYFYITPYGSNHVTQIYYIHLYEAGRTKFMILLDKFSCNFPRKLKNAVDEYPYEKLRVICV